MKSHPYPCRLTTIAHWAPVPVDHLERVLKVPQTHPMLWVNVCPSHCAHLSWPSSGLPNARLSFCELVYFFAVINAAMLYLSVKRYTVEPHIGTGWPCEWEVVAVGLGNRAFVPTDPMAQAVGHGTILGKMLHYGAVFIPAATLSCNFGPLFHCERLWCWCWQWRQWHCQWHINLGGWSSLLVWGLPAPVHVRQWLWCFLPQTSLYFCYVQTTHIVVDR